MKYAVIALVQVCLLVVQPLGAAVVVGQTAAAVAINGALAPAGTTILSSFVVSSQALPVTLHLVGQEVLVLNAHAKARFLETQEGTALSMEEGEGSYRFADGSTQRLLVGSQVLLSALALHPVGPQAQGGEDGQGQRRSGGGAVPSMPAVGGIVGGAALASAIVIEQNGSADNGVRISGGPVDSIGRNPSPAF